MPSRKKGGWNTDSMRSALADIKEKNLSIRKAAELYQIPKSTLADRVSGRIDLDARDGKLPRLSTDDEKQLITYAKDRAAMGIGFGKKAYLKYAGALAQKRGLPFKKGIPSDKWWRLHNKRFPDLSLRRPESTSSARHKEMSRENVKAFFDALESALIKNGLTNSPDKIWNMDETSLPLTMDSEKIVAGRGAKHVQSKSGFRETTTVIACASASGIIIPAHIIVKGKTKKALKSWDTENAPAGTQISVSDSGWTKQGVAELWFRDVFLPNIGPVRPQLLIFDGHNSHNHVELLTAARQSNIEFVELPSHTSHWLQPLDRTYFGPLKTNWKQNLSNYTAETGCPLTHGRFFHLFKRTWAATNEDRTKIINGFRCTGIFPLNANAIPDEAFIPNTLYKENVQPNEGIPLPMTPSGVASESFDQEPLNEALDDADLFQVMDLGITVDDSGVVTSNLDVDSSPSISATCPNPTVSSTLSPSACPLELALSAIECSMTAQERNNYERAHRLGQRLHDKRYETWKYYKTLILNAEESLGSSVTSSSIREDSDIFFVPYIEKT